MEYAKAIQTISEHQGKCGYRFRIYRTDGTIANDRYIASPSDKRIYRFVKHSRTRGFEVFASEISNWINVIPEGIAKSHGQWLQHNLKRIDKALSASGLWASMHKNVQSLLSLDTATLNEIYHIVESGTWEEKMAILNEHQSYANGRISVDMFLALGKKGAVKAIAYPKYLEDVTKEAFRKAIYSKTENYRDCWRKGYDISIELRLCDDGEWRAWYSEEYRGCGNGHYYLALDENHAVFVEND